MLIGLCGYCSGVYAQTIKGSVFFLNAKGEKEPLSGANIYVSDTFHGVYSDVNGSFLIDKTNNKEAYLIASFIGFMPDSIRIGNIQSNHIDFVLSEGVQLGEAVVSVNQQGTLLSRTSVLKTEQITSTGLMKMACCNLSESFENSATITVGFTDAVSGAKQVQLLGLSGIYCQMTDENVPTLRGLASTYGWSYTPGYWLESVQISKGASSVINGYESVSGQINVEHKKPNKSEPLFINLFIDDAKRMEANVTTATKLNDKWSVSLLAHRSREKDVHDDNGDTFMDMPKTELINLYNRWFYLDGDKGIQSRFGVKFLNETRIGGQDSACHDAEGARLYETHIKNRNFTAYNKTGIAIGDKEGQSLGIINSFTLHEQKSTFGDKAFNGVQRSFYSNWMFSSHIGNYTKHKYMAGVSLVYDNYATDFEDHLKYSETPYTEINREELVPGAFVEYTFIPNEKLTFIAGMRADYNSKYGWLYTPRANLKYSFTEDIIFRLSAGRGYRSANVIAENIGLLASSRRINVDNIKKLNMENAWNCGVNLTYYIPIWGGRTATLSFDYFRTDFRNQVIVDIERERHNVYFYNLEGLSYANAFQIDLSATLFDGFDLFTAFRFNDTQITYLEGGKEYRKEKPLTSRYRGLVNLAYATKFKKWVFDTTAQINGSTRIPGMNGYGSQERQSEAFGVLFAQITKNTRRFDIYAGVENILDYKQQDPIIDYKTPFGEEFDSSVIWGPLMGRKIYCGIRWRIGKL
jgi:hypothetical protein